MEASHFYPDMNEYKIIRSRRRTFSMEIRAQGLIVRVPLHASDRQIREFVEKHQSWVDRNLQKVRLDLTHARENALSPEDLVRLTEQAKVYIPKRTACFADKMGIRYGRITIRNQKTKWGSCSASGNLSFNCLLMLCPAQVIDSVIIHELAHRMEMNHSARFYEIVYRYCPDYDRIHSWLRENGAELMMRAQSARKA